MSTVKSLKEIKITIKNIPGKTKIPEKKQTKKKI